MVALGHWHGKCLQHMEKHNADCKILTKQKYFPTEHYIYACTHRHSEKLQTLYNYGCLSFLHVFSFVNAHMQKFEDNVILVKRAVSFL